MHGVTMEFIVHLLDILVHIKNCKHFLSTSDPREI